MRDNTTHKGDEMNNDYKVNDNNQIVSPGKFENEMRYAPYFYDKWNNGCADEDNGKWAVFYINDEDKREFPELSTAVKYTIEENDDGFVFGSTR